MKSEILRDHATPRARAPRTSARTALTVTRHHLGPRHCRAWGRLAPRPHLAATPLPPARTGRCRSDVVDAHVVLRPAGYVLCEQHDGDAGRAALYLRHGTATATTERGRVRSLDHPHPGRGPAEAPLQATAAPARKPGRRRPAACDRGTGAARPGVPGYPPDKPRPASAGTTPASALYSRGAVRVPRSRVIRGESPQSSAACPALS